MGVGVERVDFVSIPVRDRARARRFYGEVLGLAPGGPAPDEFETGNVTLALWQPEADGEPFVPHESGVALRVRDVSAARSELEAHGVEFIAETIDSGVCEIAPPARLRGQRADPAPALRVNRHRLR